MKTHWLGPYVVKEITKGGEAKKCIALQVKLKNVTCLFHTKYLITMNVKYLGPTIIAREGDQVLIKLVNHVTIHW